MKPLDQGSPETTVRLVEMRRDPRLLGGIPLRFPPSAPFPTFMSSRAAIPCMDWPFFTVILTFFANLFSVCGAALIIWGGLAAALAVILRGARGTAITNTQIRRDFTARIVFGLEFFIAGDVLTTVLEPTREELLLLCLVVIIRVILGYFLARETTEFNLEPEPREKEAKP